MTAVSSSWPWRWSDHRANLVPGEGSRRLGLLGIAAALYIYFSLKYPTFHSASNAKAILLNVSSIAIAAIGSTGLLISGNVDLSIGSQWAFNGMVIGWTAGHFTNPVFAVLAGLGMGLLMGLTDGILVVTLKISPLIVTLAMNLVWGGAAFIIGSGESLFGFSSKFVAIGTSAPFGIPTPIVVAGILFLLCGWYLSSSVYGLRIYAIGGGTEAARSNGVKVKRTIVSLYAINGILVGVVAISTTSLLSNASPQVGTTFNLDVLTAVILGGVAFNGGSGRSVGVLVGVITIGVLDAGLVFAGFQDWYQQMARGGVLLLALGADQIIANRRSSGRGRRVMSAPKGIDPDIPDFEANVGAPKDSAGSRIGESVLECRGLSRKLRRSVGRLAGHRECAERRNRVPRR